MRKENQRKGKEKKENVIIDYNPTLRVNIPKKLQIP